MNKNNFLNFTSNSGKLRIFVLLLSLLVLGLISYVLVNWEARTRFLVNINTVILSLLLTVAIVFQALKKERVVLVLAISSLFILFFGSFTSFFEWEKSLDSFLNKYFYVHIQPSIPLPLNAAFGLSLAATALICLTLKRPYFLLAAKVIAGCVVSIGMLTLIGIVANVLPAYQWNELSGMSIYSAVIIIILGAQIIFLTLIQDEEHQPYQHPFHILLPIAIILTATQIGVYIAILLQRDLEIKDRIDAVTLEIEDNIKQLYDQAEKSTNLYVIALKDLSYDQESAKKYGQIALIDSDPGFQGALLMDQNLKILWEIWNTAPISDLSEIFKEELQNKQSFSTHYPKRGFLFFKLLQDVPDNWVWVVTFFEDKKIFEQIFEELKQTFQYSILNEDKEIISQSKSFEIDEHLFSQRYLTKKNISYKNGKWTMYLKPKKSFFLKFAVVYLATLILGLGFLFSALMLASIYNFLKSNLNEKKALSLEERLDSLISSSLDAIVSANQQGKIIGWNEGAEKIFGYSHAEAVGELFTIMLPERIRERYFKDLNNFLETGESEAIGHVFDIMGRRKSGEEFPMEVAVAHWEYQNQSFFTAIMRDQTERKSNELRLIESKKQAEQANKLKNEYLAAISHEMRTPISAILGYSELIPEEESSRNLSEYMKIINLNSKRLLSFSDDIIEISALESHPINLDVSHFSPRQVAEDVLQVMEPVAKEKNLKLFLELKEPFAPLISSDQEKIFQVLVKLLDCLIKFTKKGEIILTLSQANEKEIQFNITSTGGILENIKLHQQLLEGNQNSAFLVLNGTGLALVLAKKLIEALHGTLSFYTLPHYGTSFVVKFDTQLQNLKNLAKPSSTSLKGKRILLVDDNEDTLKLFAAFLRKAEVQFDTAEDGQRAIEKGMQALEQKQPYDLILMDLDMPILTGFDAVSKLREANYTAPIAALTAFATKNEENKCMSAGFNAVIVKPISRDKFLERIKDLV